tara:strand:- start:2393 stop:2851 length:459 start_codon:yes stop_codon:yes gene_type:complete
LNTTKLSWEWNSFSELDRDKLYEILKFRQEIFVVEQKSWYLDADGLDQSSLHLMVTNEQNLIGYLRLTPPGAKYTEASIGRVSIHDERRGEGIGKKLLVMGLKKGKETYGTGSFRISAQEYLISYYESHGFKVQGNPYDEDGIPHVEMLLDE